MAVLAGGSLEVFSINWATTMHQEIPPDKLSRVASYDALGNYALRPAGTAIAGPLASAFGTRAILTVGGALVAVLPVLVLLIPEGRHMRRFVACLTSWQGGPRARAKLATQQGPGTGVVVR